MSSTEQEDNAVIDASAPTQTTNDGRVVGEDGIVFMPFANNHRGPAAVMTLKAYAFPENILAATEIYTNDAFGVVAVDETTSDDDDNDKLAGYYLAKSVFPYNTVGLRKKKVANLAQICTSSNYQKRGIATRLGRYMMDGSHPHFNPQDFDEIIVQDTDVYSSPSWLFSDRCGFRYFPTIDIIKRFGLVGYVQLCLTMTHVLPGQFLKRYVKSAEEEVAEADKFEEQKGMIMYFISGLLPCTYWAIHYVIQCNPNGGVDGLFVGYLFVVMYMMLCIRWLLAHALVHRSESIRPVFREYDFWWGISITGCLGHVTTIIAGFPLLGYTGGFYLGGKGVNYLKAENKRAIALVQLPIILFTLALFLALTLLRVFQPSSNAFVQVLGYASFYFSVTDVGLGLIEAFPSPAVCVRRWNIWVFAALWLSWLVLMLVTFLVPSEVKTSACKA